MPNRRPANKKMARGQANQLKAVGLQRDGWSVEEIATKLSITPNYVNKLLRWAREAEQKASAPAVVPYDQLSDEVKATREFTADGFERFFNRYSNFLLPPHMKQWVAEALGHDRILINCPPRHGKSKIFSVWFPIWLVTMDRDVQIIIASQTLDFAKKFTREIAEHMEHNDLLIEENGRYLPSSDSAPWAPGLGALMVEGRRRLALPGDLTIKTKGAGQQILGMEAEWVIVDDPVMRKHVSSETEREKLSEWFHGDVMTRLQPKGHIIVIGQRLGLGDLYGELAEKTVPELGEDYRVWTHINYPAVSKWPTDEDPKAEVLWPTFWDFDRLMVAKADVTRKDGPRLWNTMYQQNPLADTDVLVPPEWIFGEPGCLDRDRTLGTGLSANERKCRIITLDPSPTMFAGLICMDIEVGQHYPRFVLVDLVREKMGVRDMIANLEAMVARYYPVHYLVIETNSARFFMQGEDFRRWSDASGVRIVGHNTARNKQDPEWGVNSLARDFEFGRIRIPWSGPEAQRVFQPLVDEATSYPYGQTDDLMMALWFGKYNYRRLPAVQTAPNVITLRPRKSFQYPKSTAGGWPWLNKKRI